MQNFVLGDQSDETDEFDHDQRRGLISLAYPARSFEHPMTTSTRNISCVSLKSWEFDISFGTQVQ